MRSWKSRTKTFLPGRRQGKRQGNPSLPAGRYSKRLSFFSMRRSTRSTFAIILRSRRRPGRRILPARLTGIPFCAGITPLPRWKAVMWLVSETSMPRATSITCSSTEATRGAALPAPSATVWSRCTPKRSLPFIPRSPRAAFLNGGATGPSLISRSNGAAFFWTTS